MNTVRDQSVVDRVVDPVGSGFVDLELDVVDEGLAVELLLGEYAMPAEHLQPVQLDDHSIAPATVSASTVSRTSCTRRIVAPRS